MSTEEQSSDHLDAVSQSPWANIYFYRDTTFDGLVLGTQAYAYHYAEDPSQANQYVSASRRILPTTQPSTTREMDVFLMNDASSGEKHHIPSTWWIC
jgi:hypothetical protein